MTSHSQLTVPYFVPHPSQHPLMASLSLLAIMSGLTAWINGHYWGIALFVGGLLVLFRVLFHWFGDAIRESRAGQYCHQVDRSFRLSMSWFIFSEVAFFAAFFSALFYARILATPMLGDLEHKLLWPDFIATWPNLGPAAIVSHFATMSPWPIPTVNTALLLSSGVTLTLSHHALRDNHRRPAIIWLAATVLLGFIFLLTQGYEYFHAYTELNLRLTSGAYGSTFFLLTGFHGFHVFLGATMLSVVLYRLIKGDFSPNQHFAFEGAAWYWHFVDVVWLALYVVVYWL